MITAQDTCAMHSLIRNRFGSQILQYSDPNEMFINSITGPNFTFYCARFLKPINPDVLGTPQVICM
jgi:hypothetical protein